MVVGVVVCGVMVVGVVVCSVVVVDIMVSGVMVVGVVVCSVVVVGVVVADILLFNSLAKLKKVFFARIISKISALTILQHINFINNKPFGKIKHALL